MCSADLDLLDGGGLGVGHGAGVGWCVDGRETVAGLDTAPQPSAHFISAAPRRVHTSRPQPLQSHAAAPAGCATGYRPARTNTAPSLAAARSRDGSRGRSLAERGELGCSFSGQTGHWAQQIWHTPSYVSMKHVSSGIVLKVGRRREFIDHIIFMDF